MNKRRPYDEELWEKIDPLLFDRDLDLMEILCRLDNGEFLEQLDKEDLILGLSGVDDGAVERVECRRKSLDDIKKEISDNKTKRERAIKNMESGKGAFKRNK